MNINQNELHELYCKIRKPFARDERFYAVPNAKGYALSTYCRLLHRKHDYWYEVIKPIGEYYRIKFDKEQNEKKINIGTLAARVFFPKIENGYLYPFASGYSWHRWKIEKLHLLVGREMLVEALSAKINRRSPNYDDDYKKHMFINRWEPNYRYNFNSHLDSHYKNLRTRATNEKYKKRFPIYAETSICNEWLNNPAKFKQWFIDNQYDFKGRIDVDKDLLGFGKKNEYNPEYCCLLPRSINRIFTSSPSKLGYSISKVNSKNNSYVYVLRKNVFGGIKHNIRFENYSDALKAGRNLKAANIRNIAEQEKEKGQIPEKTLNIMLRWANLCEMGLIDIWEPNKETLASEGVYD